MNLHIGFIASNLKPNATYNLILYELLKANYQ
jgi:hypothetical protein